MPNSIKTIDYYLAWRLMTMFLFALLGVFFLVFMMEFIDHIRKASGRNIAIPINIVLLLTFFRAFNNLFELLPYVSLIANIICFYRLNINQELVILRGCGYSTRQLIQTPMVVSLVIGMSYLIFINPLQSLMNERYYNKSNELFGQQLTSLSLLNEDLWLREYQPNTDKILIIHAKESSNQAKDLKIVEFYIQAKSGAIEAIIKADSAKLITETDEYGKITANYWHLRNVAQDLTGGKIENYNELKLNSSIDAKNISGSVLGPETISIFNLHQYAQNLALSGFNASAYYIRFFALLSVPLSIIAMQLIGVGFALRQQTRMRKISLIFKGILLGFLIFFGTQIIFAYGQIFKIPAALVGIIPTLIALIFGIYILLYHED